MVHTDKPLLKLIVLHRHRRV